MKPRAAIPDALAVLPLVQGMDGESSPFTLARNVPALVARSLADESQNTRVALISPIDYARHAGSYRIVPGIAVSTRAAAGVARVRVRPDARMIQTLAVDPRVTTDIVLASVLVAEKYPAATEAARKLPTIMPVPDTATVDFATCDAVLDYHPWLSTTPGEAGFSFDLYEEWADLTGLPWVSAFWVMREEEGEEAWSQALVSARDRGVSLVERIGQDAGRARGIPAVAAVSHLQSFSYDLGQEQQEALQEFFQYAYYLGIITDVPDLTFFDPLERVE
ncbi:MAG: MqnA/MqnD/SBP family protein [Bacteroidota bacterium]